ncbi:MAG: MlaA family lipoprotein [Candidatus Competibacteraceae bacterium]
MFTFNDKVDIVVLKPLARNLSQFIMPELLNDGVTNFFSNINDVTSSFSTICFQVKIGTGGHGQ